MCACVVCVVGVESGSVGGIVVQGYEAMWGEVCGLGIHAFVWSSVRVIVHVCMCGGVCG